jgi:hypothetical protein
MNVQGPSYPIKPYLNPALEKEYFKAEPKLTNRVPHAFDYLCAFAEGNPNPTRAQLYQIWYEFVFLCWRHTRDGLDLISYRFQLAQRLQDRFKLANSLPSLIRNLDRKVALVVREGMGMRPLRDANLCIEVIE